MLPVGESGGRLAWRSVGGQSAGQSACYRRAMRRVGIVLGLVLLTAAHVEAAEPGSANAPPKSQPPAASKAAAAPPAAQPTPAAAAPGQSSAAPAAQPASASAPAGDAPPGEFYVEPAAEPTGTPPPPSSVPQPPGPPPPPPVLDGDGRIFEPPAPDFYPEGERVFEPPPPPEPRHVAPRTALWLGVRAGLFLPFGSLWARCLDCSPTNQYPTLRGVAWRDYASAGPMFELDAGSAPGSKLHPVRALGARAARFGQRGREQS